MRQQALPSRRAMKAPPRTWPRLLINGPLFLCLAIPGFAADPASGETAAPATMVLHPLSANERLHIEEKQLRKRAEALELEKRSLIQLEAALLKSKSRAVSSRAAARSRGKSRAPRRRARAVKPAPSIPWQIPQLPRWVQAWGLAVQARSLDMPFDQVWPAGASSFCAGRKRCPLTSGNWKVLPRSPGGYQNGISPCPSRYYWTAPMPLARR